MKKITYLIPASFLGLFLLINLLFTMFENDYKKDVEMLNLPSGKINCLLFGGSPLQRQACLRNFNPLKSSTKDNDLNVILDGLCSTGSAVSCITKNQLATINQRVGLNSTTPYNLNWLSDNCINTHQKSISTADRIVNCALLKEYAEIVDAKTTIDFVNQQQCILNPHLCLDSLKSNYLFTLEQNYNLSSYNCGKHFYVKWKIEELNLYCKNLDSIIKFQESFLPLITSSTNPNIDFTKKFDQLCEKNSDNCNKIINQPVFLNKLINLDPRFNFRYFDKFKVDVTAGLYLRDNLTLMSNANLNGNYPFKNRVFNLLSNAFNEKYSENMNECLSNEDKSFCFLSFKTILDAKKNKKELEIFCNKGDGISCAYLTIIKNSSTLGLVESKEILLYFYDYESFVLDYLQKKNDSISYLSFLQGKRFWIISFLLTANIFFIAYFLFAFRNINAVFVYLKNEKIKELASKLKNK